MEKTVWWCLVLTCLLVPLAGAADWNILKLQTHDGLKISLKNYCESWRMNVELHNIREFQVVPEECIEYIGKYVTSTQYKVDSQRATEECLVYLSTSCNLKKDGFDAWIFDIDDTLLSTVPYYKDNLYGGRKLNVTSLEEWMKSGKAPALDHSLKLYDELKSRGVQILLVTSRKEHLRSATIDNLVKVGYYGWTKIIFRDPANELVSVEKYKSDVRKKIVNDGYRIWGILGDQYSSIQGIPNPKRAFKLPNPMYYVA
ncbi:acid phosphatase 1 [Vigna radiata var. radiata]|uniref:Acid phosphatase 1 n=1 Tax=Vigna radiata var. radiata TaxID=3916 RepID=A0A1S3V3T2_VIGRR|nr:acid phosphatase 1 [Vigna radiata var. radiata]